MQTVPRKQCPQCFQIATMAATRCTVCGSGLRTQYLLPPPPPPPPRPLDRWCVTSLVLAIGSIVALALPLGLSAVLVGVVGLERRGRGGTFAWWGVGIGVLTAAYGFWKSGVRLF